MHTTNLIFMLLAGLLCTGNALAHDAAPCPDVTSARKEMSTGSYKAFLEAIAANDIAAVHRMLEEGVDARSMKGAMHQAIRRKRGDMATLLIHAGADIHARGSHENTALHAAAYAGLVDVARLLMEKGADPNAVADTGKTPLMLAAQGNAPQAARLLLEKGASVYAMDASGGSALMYAATAAAPDVARLLLAHGADANARTHDGNTALHCAVMALKRDEQDRLQMLQLVAERGGDLNAGAQRGVTPLMMAARFPQPAVVRCLLELGADVNIQEQQGYTALHIAVQAERFEYSREGALSVAEILLAHGANLNLHQGHRYGALQEALEHGSDAMALLLLRHCEDVTVRFGVLQRSCLIHAAVGGSIAVCTELLQRGVDVNAADTQGTTPLLMAIGWNHAKLVRLLLEHGADANAVDSFGYTPLKRVRKQRQSPPPVKDKKAYRRNCELMEQILIQYGARE